MSRQPNNDNSVNNVKLTKALSLSSIFKTRPKRGEAATLEADIKRITTTNKKLLAELQAAELYDKVRGVSSGQARTNFTLSLIESNKKDIETLKAEIVAIKQKSSFWNVRMHIYHRNAYV